MSRMARRYRRSLPYSYTYGVYPTLELLSVRPECVDQILLHTPDKGGQGIEKIRRLSVTHGIPTSTCPAQIRKLSGRGFPVVAMFHKYDSPISPRANHVVLHRPQYKGNVGTVIRTMAGFRFRHLAIINPAPDVMSPEVIRASMGAVFRSCWRSFDDLDAYHRAFPMHRLYCFMTDGDVSLDRIAPRGSFSLVFGAEGAGLPQSTRELGTTVRIRHDQDIDSLNLGVAVGIALHGVSRSCRLASRT